MRAARLLRAARLSVFTVCRNRLLNKVDDDDDDDDVNLDFAYENSIFPFR